MPQEEARPTQEFVDIESVENGVIVLKNKSLRQILIVSGVNFDLKSEDEQKIIIASYQNLLNSLKFSLQIFVHSRRVNLDNYLLKLEGRVPNESNELLRAQITEYISFIKSFVGKNPIMTKAFFVVVPFDPIILPGAAKAAGGGLARLFGRGKRNPTESEQADKHLLAQNMEQLNQRTSQIVTALSQVGLRAVPLQTEEAVELFYNLYNPEAVERRGVTL